MLTDAPRLISWILSYTLFLGYFSLLIYNFADRDISYNLSANLLFFAFLWIIVDLYIFYDWVWYSYGHPSFISKAKTSQSYFTKDLLIAAVNIRIAVFTPTIMFTYFGLMTFPWRENPIWVLLESYGQFIVTLILRDLFGMLPFHIWMHKKAYHLHKRHHMYTKDINVLNSAEFDILDSFLENGIGATLAVFLFQMVGKTYLMPAYIFFMWHDIGIHSLNPYCPVLLNPILDYILRPTVSHNLHHIMINSHYIIFPVHHLFGDGRDKDIQLYNEKMDTQVF